MFDFITSFLEKTGYAGVFLLMLAENLFPPLPSEVIMPLAGFNAARGDLHIVAVTAVGTAGSLLGALFWYFLGRRIGLERLEGWAQRGGRWIAVYPDELTRATDWFSRHCAKAVLLGRLVPTVRTLISVPAGITRMQLGRFLLYSAIGSALWTSALAGAGYLLEDQYEQVARYLDPAANLVFAAIAGTYLYRVATFKRQRHA
ncbi:MAG: DedA family protein [Betaproteobacteria bacterium]|nr:DedA family protein [Betaproteobacteria bacterium]